MKKSSKNLYLPPQSKLLAQFKERGREWAFIKTTGGGYLLMIFGKQKLPDFVYEFQPSVGFRKPFLP